MMRPARTVVAGICGIVAVLSAVFGTIGVWANRTVFDSDRFAATVDDTLADPVVTDALAEFVTRQVFTIVPVTDTTARLLPGRTQALAPNVTDRVQSGAEARLRALLEQPTTRARIVKAARASHASLLAAVDSGSVANLQLSDGAISMNLLPLVVDGLRVLPDNPITRRFTLPQLAYGGDHTRQLAELSDALGMELPADLGMIEVYRSDTVDRADTVLTTVRSSIVLFHRTLSALVVVGVLSLIATLLVAVNRRRALLGLTLAGALGFAAALFTFRHSIGLATEMARDPANQTVAHSLLTGLTHGLMTALAGGSVICAVIAVAMWLLGRLPGIRH